MSRHAGYRSTLTDIEVTRHWQTEMAIRVSTTGLDKDAVWLPKSQCEFEASPENRNIGTLTLSEALATEKGLV